MSLPANGAVGPRFLDLPGMVNARDLGGWPGRDGTPTAFDRVWRSDAPVRADRATIDTLFERGVRTVLDLRTEHEREADPSPLEADARFSVLHIDLMAPVAASIRRGAFVGNPLDLEAHYAAMLDVARDRLVMAFEHLREGLERGISLVHCTAGKDRTGVLAAVLLRASGVAPETVAHEYALTHDRIETLRPRLLAAGASLGIPAEHYAPMLRADPATMRATLDGVDDRLLREAAGILDGA